MQDGAPTGSMAKSSQVASLDEPPSSPDDVQTRRQSPPHRLDVDEEEPAIPRKKAFHFDDPLGNRGKRFGGSGESSDQDLTFLRGRDEKTKKLAKTPNPKRDGDSGPRTQRGGKYDVAEQWQKLRSARNVSKESLKLPGKSKSGESAKRQPHIRSRPRGGGKTRR